jgi:hypothetical protein
VSRGPVRSEGIATPILECRGVFELVVPDGWAVTGDPGSYYELAPAEGEDLAINISVHSPIPGRCVGVERQI